MESDDNENHKDDISEDEVINLTHYKEKKPLQKLKTQKNNTLKVEFSDAGEPVQGIGKEQANSEYRPVSKMTGNIFGHAN